MYHEPIAEGGNLFYSPYSISLALATAYEGAGGETEEQMSDTPRFGLPQDRSHSAFSSVDIALSARSDEDGGFELKVANSAWR